MEDDKFKVLVDRIEKIQIVVDLIQEDIGKIYNNNQELAIRVGGAENQLRELRDSVHNLPQDTKNKVSDAVKPVITEAKELKESIQEKKVIYMKEKSVSFFRKVWRWLH
jgi:hypothetical protein